MAGDVLSPEFRELDLSLFLSQPLKDADIAFAKSVNHYWNNAPSVAENLRRL